MFPRSQRLTRSADIKRVVTTGQARSTPHLRLYWQAGTEAHTRVACVVGKRVSRQAVVRHRLQRQLRHALTEALAALPTQVAYDLVVVANPSLAQLDSAAAWREELFSVLAGIVK